MINRKITIQEKLDPWIHEPVLVYMQIQVSLSLIICVTSRAWPLLVHHLRFQYHGCSCHKVKGTKAQQPKDRQPVSMELNVQ